MDQAAIFVAGGLLATGISAWWKSANLDGAERQLSILQLLLKIFATAVILPLLLIEHFFGIPTLVAASGMISHEASIQLMLLWWLGGLLPAIVLVPINDWTVRLLARISPPTERESLVRPQYIFPQAAAEPAGALDLARLEQNRAFAVVPKMLEPVCQDGPGDVDSASLQSGAATLVAEIDHFLGVTMQSSSGEKMTEAIMSAKYLNQVIKELMDTASEISSLVLTIRKGAREIDIFTDLIEPLHAMLCEATDWMTPGNPDAAKVIIQLGRPRDDLFTELRTRVLTGSGRYTVKQKEAFYRATRLSERMVWLIQRVGTSLAKMQGSSTFA
jgi:phosphate:Na+ symporter